MQADFNQVIADLAGGKMKNIRKNREALIRHFYSLPKPTPGCLCAKQQVTSKFTGSTALLLGKELPDSLHVSLNITGDQLAEMEALFEGWHGEYGNGRKHDFQQLADYLQKLPGWPKVL